MEKQIWNGTSVFYPGQTPFQFYDQDPVFQTEADKVARFCALRLGYPLMDVELQSGSFYACFEEAITTYGNEVFQYKVRENYLNMEGSSLDVSANESLIGQSLHRIIQLSNDYGTEAGVGGYVTKYSGSIDVQIDQQEYDLNQWAENQNIQGGIEIRKVFYEAPPAILRYFDPYAGTGTGLQSLMDAFDFGSYSPGINFLLMPISFDLLKLQAIEFNDQIRRSGYSFELVNNKLKLFPIPRTAGKMHFEYYKISEKGQAVFRNADGLITSVMDVPYSNPVYSQINSIGKQWIYKYTLALAKELLGYIRGKYATIPTPGSEVTLNHADLLADGRTERESLLTNLREMLEETSRNAQLERKALESENLSKTLTSVPLPIFIG